MLDKIYDVLDELENNVYNGLLVFSAWSVVKDNIINMTDKIYNNLPSDLIQNRKLIEQRCERNVFKLIGDLYAILSESKKFLGYLIINKSMVLNIVDNIYATLPDNIKVSREINRE